MDAEEGILRVGNRVDESAHQFALFGFTAMYSPRNGTIRGPSSPSTGLDIRSAWSPAQTTSWSTRCRGAALASLTSMPALRRSIAVTGVDRMIVPPAAAISAANASEIAT